MWEASIPAINKYLADESGGELCYGHADMQTGERTKVQYGAPDVFFPGLLALSGDLERARRLQSSSFKMWNLHVIEPETIDYKTMRVVAGSYRSRPEVIESTYYLFITLVTRNIGGWVRKCSMTSLNIAAPKLITRRSLTWSLNNSSMKWRASPWPRLSNIFIYSFAPPETLQFDRVIFNSEAHPLKRTW